jgi:hypothetical protein
LFDEEFASDSDWPGGMPLALTDLSGASQTMML